MNNREIINYVGIHVTKVTTITDAELRKYKNFLVVYRNWWTLWTKYIFTREYKSLQAIVFQLHEVSTYQYMISKDKEPIF